MQLCAEAVVLVVVIAVVVVGNDIAIGVKQPQPRVNHCAVIELGTRHIRIERDMQQRLAVESQSVVVIRFIRA